MMMMMIHSTSKPNRQSYPSTLGYSCERSIQAQTTVIEDQSCHITAGRTTVGVAYDNLNMH